VTDLRAAAGGIRPLLAEGYASVSPVQADLRLRIANDRDLQLTGSVRNGDMPLEDAVLVVGDEVYQFGTLRANETVSVGLAFTASTDVVSVLKGGYTDMPALIVGADELWSDPDLYRRYRFLSALYATGTVDPLVYLVGWTNAPAPLPVELSGSQATKQGTTVVVYRMVLDGVEGHGRFILPPGFMAREVEETSAGVSLDSGPQGSLYLEAGAHVVLRFTPWTEGLVDDVDRLTVTAQGDNPNGLAEPTVSLWDEERAVWDPLASAWGASAEVDADRYLLQAGQVRIRVDADEAGPVWVFGVGVALAGQR
jgi:hypothetical protein